MVEYIKHLLGLCGEPHGLIFTLKTLFSVGSLSFLIYFFKYKITFNKQRGNYERG